MIMTTNQITPMMAASLPEFNLNSVRANTTYVVSTDITINNSVNLPINVTLIFAGGKLIGNGSLKANNTQVVANIVQIFDINLQLSGSWITERAYPQWWGAQNTYDSFYPDDSLDATAAINKAIQFKRTGEVFIPRGCYLVAGTIEMPICIILKGEKAYPRETSRDKEPQNDYQYQGTVLITNKKASHDDYKSRYMVLVNIDSNGPISTDGNWAKEYPEYHTAIYDINFHNDSVKNMKCILVGGGFEIKYCRWTNFIQAVATLKKYSDLKSISHCAISNFITGHDEVLFAFDFDLGDAATFKNVHFYQDEPQHEIYKALRVNLCHSGEIANNIFNRSVEISNSKAIDFTSNHLESANTQLTVLRSIINISDNYFEKGIKPSLHLDGYTTDGYDRVVATLNNNFFGFYDKDKANKPTISAYDIQTNGSVVLSINNCYRYWVNRDWGNRVAPYGIMICDSNGNPVSSFNSHSYVLSNNGRLMPNYSVSNNNSVILNQTLSSSWYGRTSNVVWYANTGTYKYRAQIVWDKNRRIIGNNILNIGSLALTNKGPGASLSLGGITEGGCNCIVRLEREFNGQRLICDIPLCGALHIYDNGENVSGYVWEAGTLLDGLKPTNTLQFTGKNVICRANAAPTLGTWVDGDIVYNTSTGSNALWIRIQGGWQAK